MAAILVDRNIFLIYRKGKLIKPKRPHPLPPFHPRLHLIKNFLINLYFATKNRARARVIVICFTFR